MVSLQQTARCILSLILVGVFITACGGSDSGGPAPTATPTVAVTPTPSPEPDTTPENFSFAPAMSAALSSQVTSNAVTVAGIDAAAAISISGGEYAVEGGDFVATEGTIENGQSVVVRVTTATTFATGATATLTIGGVSADFVVTTVAEDTTPDEFSFTAIDGQPLDSTVLSEAITVAGINSPAAISVENGRYRIGDGEFTSDAGTVALGQSVQLEVTSSSELSTATTSTLTIGGVEAVFTATTRGDTEAPTAEIYFPTPNTMSDGTSLTLRGVASDGFGVVTRVDVVVKTDAGAATFDEAFIEAPTDGDLSSGWSVQVDLAPETVNTIEVRATDDAGNLQSEASVVTVMQVSELVGFPADVEEPLATGRDAEIFFDSENDRILVPTERGTLVAVDTMTGQSTEFFDDPSSNISFGMEMFDPGELVVSGSNEAGNRALFELDITTKEVNVLYQDMTDPSSFSVRGFDRHEITGEFWVASFQGLQIVDTELGTRTLFRGSDSEFRFPQDIVLDEANNRAWVATFSGLFTIDLTTRAIRKIDIDVEDAIYLYLEPSFDGRSIYLSNSNLDNRATAPSGLFVLDTVTELITPISTELMPVDEVDFVSSVFTSIVVDESRRTGFIFTRNEEPERSAIVVVDIESGERMILNFWLGPNECSEDPPQCEDP